MHQILLLVPHQEDLIEMMMVKVSEVEGAPVGAVEVEEEAAVEKAETEIEIAAIQVAAASETEMIDIDQATAEVAEEEEEDLEIMRAVEEEEPVPMIEALDLVMEEEVVVEEENLTPLVRISHGKQNNYEFTSMIRSSGKFISFI
jgi:hypothetical protein